MVASRVRSWQVAVAVVEEDPAVSQGAEAVSVVVAEEEEEGGAVSGVATPDPATATVKLDDVRPSKRRWTKKVGKRLSTSSGCARRRRRRG